MIRTKTTVHLAPALHYGEGARVSAWMLVPICLTLHGVVATCVPEVFEPLSTIFIVLAEWKAIVACVTAFKKASASTKTPWLLLVGSIFIHSMAMVLEAVTEITKTPIFNHVGGLQILFSMLYGVPLLLAVSLQHDPRLLPVARIINAGLSIAVGTVLYFEIFSVLTVHGSANLSDAIVVTYLIDAMDVFLAVAGTIRWLGSNQNEEFRFFRVLAIFLWMNTIFPAVHNRILIHHDYVWLDLFISAPYITLVPLVVTTSDRPSQPASPTFVRTVRSGSSVFLSGALVFMRIVHGSIGNWLP